MKKNKLFKRTALALGTVATVAAPVAAVVSCGNTIGRYEGKDDGEIRLLVDYQVKRDQYKGLEEQVELFNKTETATKNHFHVKVVPSGNGKTASAITSTYQSQDINKMGNLAIAYPDTLGLVTHYGQELDFSKTKPAVSTAAFADEYLAVNDKIGGLAKGGTYAIPVTKSTDMTVVDQLVIGHMLEEMGVTPEAGSTKLIAAKAKFDAGETGDTTAAEKSAITARYKKKSGYQLPTDFKVSDKIFTDGKALLQFAVEAGKCFDLKADHNATTKRFVVGIDSATNFIYNSMNAIIGGDPTKFPFVKETTGEGWIKYKFKDKEIQAKVDEIYSLMKDAMNTGALFIAGEMANGKEYASNFLTNHRIGISLGSTAGYNYNFKSVKALDGKTGTVPSGYKSPIPTLSDADSKIKDKVKEYDKKVSDRKTWLENLTEAELKAVNDYEYYLKIQKANADVPKGLNEDEMDALAPVESFGTSDKSVLIQGPSLIGLHVTEKEDNEAALFVNWFVGGGASDSPLEKFTKKAGYLAPTKTFMKSTPVGLSKGNQIAFEALKSITSDAHTKGFDNPVDDTTGQMRIQLQNAIHEQYKQVQEGGTAQGLDTIYTYVHRNFPGFE